MNLKKIIDEFLELNPNLFKENEIEVSSGKGRESIGGSLFILINSNEELIIRLKKITGKKIFGGLKWEWSDYIINTNKNLNKKKTDFILTPEENLIYDNLPKLYESLRTESYKEKTIGQLSKKNYTKDIFQTIKEIHYSRNKEIVEIERGNEKYEFWFFSEKINTLEKKNQDELFLELSNQTSKFKRNCVVKKRSSFKYLFREVTSSGNDKRGGIKFTIHILLSKGYIISKFEDISIGKKRKHPFVVKIIKRFFDDYDKHFSRQQLKFLKQKEEKEEKEKKEKEEKEKIELDKQKTSEKKNSLIRELDKDSDGTLDIVQTDVFHEILKKHEKSIIEIDRDYIKNFVKLSNYLKTIRNNLQNTFEILTKVEFSKDLEPLIKILKNKIHTYNSLLLHSLSMIVSLTKDEMITFYEIYEIFDELNVFDSKHEKDIFNGIKSINSELGEVNKNIKKVGGKLGEIGGKLGEISGQFYDLMTQMKESDERIINSVDNLTYTTSSSLESLSNNVQNELNSINSSIKFNNLLTGIQSYQMYKINLNTKSLRG
jgi:Sec-independent protein translocase protein TatA